MRIEGKYVILCTIITIGLVFLMTLFDVKADSKPPENGDWIIDDVVFIKNDDLELNGSLYVEKEGKLTLDNVTLKINLKNDLEYKIFVSKEGEFQGLNNTTISSMNSKYTFRFEVYGNMKIDNCEIRDLWGIYSPGSDDIELMGGIEIYSSDTTISNCTITNFRKNAIFCDSSDVIIENNTIEIIEGYNFVTQAIRCESSEVKILNNKINNTYYGINLNNSNAILYKNNFNMLRPNFVINCTNGNVLLKDNIFNDQGYSLGCKNSDIQMKNNSINGIELVECNKVVINNNSIGSFLLSYYSNLTLTNNKLKNLIIYFGYAFITNNSIIYDESFSDYGIFGLNSKVYIYNNSIYGKKIPLSKEGYGIGIFNEKMSVAKIKNNLIDGNNIGISCNYAVISENIFSNNDIGLDFSMGNCEIENNTFSYNNEAIRLGEASQIITKNNFENNQICIHGRNANFDLEQVKNENKFLNNNLRVLQKKFFDIIVIYPNLAPVSDASILIKNKNEIIVWNGTTDNNGRVFTSTKNDYFTFVEYELDNKGNEIIYSPYNITVSKDNVSNWTSIDLSKITESITIIIEYPKIEIKDDDEIIKKDDKNYNLIIYLSVILFFGLIYYLYLPSKLKRKQRTEKDRIKATDKNPGINLRDNDKRLKPPHTLRSEDFENQQVSNEIKAKVNILVMEGQAFHNNRKYLEAIQSFDKALAILPNYNTYYYKALSLNKLERYNLALLCCDQALKKDLDNNNVIFLKGLLLNKLKRYKDAIPFLTKSLELNPESEKGWFNKGWALDEIGEYEKALTCLQKALDLRENAETFTRLGITKFHLKKYEEAINYFNKSIQLKPKYDEAYYFKGILFKALKKYKEAISNFEDAYKFNSKNEKAKNEIDVCRRMIEIEKKITGKR